MEALSFAPTDLRRECIRFLSLVGRSGQELVPSRLVDEVIHSILADADLRSSVEQELGWTFEHDSGLDGERMLAAYAETIRLYEATYGPPPPEFWGSATSWPNPGSRPSVCGVKRV